MIELPIKLNSDFNNGECDHLALENIKKWLRDELNIHVLLDPVYDENAKNCTAYYWNYMNVNMEKKKFVKTSSKQTFPTYELALTDCINVLINE